MGFCKIMNIGELKSKIEGFHGVLHIYRDLLLKSKNAMARIVRNGSQLEEIRSELNRKYGALSRYIKKLGNNPMSSDIGGGPYPVYETAFSLDILQRRGPCIDLALQDLDYIIGKLDSMSEDEFGSIFALHQLETTNQQSQKKLIEGVEIYAKNIINNGVISSDSKTKVVTENYKGNGEISSSKKVGEKWYLVLLNKLILPVLVIVIATGVIYFLSLNN